MTATLSSVTRSGDGDSAAEATAEIRHPVTRGQVLGWIAAGVFVFIVFELALYLTAVTVFTHVDTPRCAGSNTFCSPDGRPGPTGGAVVMLAGNLTAVVVASGATVLKHRPSRNARA